MQWEIEPTVDIEVRIWEQGPTDPIFGSGAVSFTSFDVTRWVRDQGITIRRGRSDELDHVQSAGCSLTLNNEGRRFDPTFAASPYISILKPRRLLSVQVTRGGQSHILFWGFIQGWPQSQDDSDVQPVVQIQAQDLLTTLARTRIGDLAFVLDVSRLDIDALSGNLPVQYTGERVAALVGLAGFTETTFVATDRGLTLMPAADGGGDLLSAAQAAEKAEAGFFYISREGAIVFLDRHARFNNPALSTVQATFHDGEYSDLTVDNDLVRTWNSIQFSRPGGVPQHHRVPASVAEYGVITYGPDTIEVLSDGEALARAQFMGMRYATVQPRPSPITIKPRRDMDALFEKCVTLDLFRQVAIERTPQGIPPMVTYTGLTDSVEHQITNDDWTTVLSASPYDVQDGTGFLRLGHSTQGNLDQERLAY